MRMPGRRPERHQSPATARSMSAVVAELNAALEARCTALGVPLPERAEPSGRLLSDIGVGYGAPEPVIRQPDPTDRRRPASWSDVSAAFARAAQLAGLAALEPRT